MKKQKLDKNKEKPATTHKIGIYLWIWGLLFVLSFFLTWLTGTNFKAYLRWSLILFFMFLKAGFIMAFFMHLFWERYTLSKCFVMAYDCNSMFCRS